MNDKYIDLEDAQATVMLLANQIRSIYLTHQAPKDLFSWEIKKTLHHELLAYLLKDPEPYALKKAGLQSQVQLFEAQMENRTRVLSNIQRRRRSSHPELYGSKGWKEEVKRRQTEDQNFETHTQNVYQAGGYSEIIKGAQTHIRQIQEATAFVLEQTQDVDFQPEAALEKSPTP